ncbi:MAG: DUF3466 family protein [Parachlamydiaceae bacterium]
MLKKYISFVFVVLMPCCLFSLNYQVSHIEKNPIFPHFPVKLNNNGIVVGTKGDLIDGYWKQSFFIYDSKEEKNIYIDVVDHQIERIFDVNNNNEIVGFYSTENFSPNSGRKLYYVPFVYSNSKGFSSLGSTLIQIDGYNLFGSHMEINDFGLMAGYGFVDSIFNFFSHKGNYRYGHSSLILDGRTGLILNHPTHPLQMSICVKSLNNNSDVSGGIFYGVGQDARIYKPAHAFMYDYSQKKIISLGNLGHEDKFYSCATCINDSKQIVGLSELNIKKKNNKYSYHAFLWENGSLLDLGTLENDEDSVAYSINNNGDIVGISGNRDINDYYDWGYGFRRAFIWTKQNGMLDLNEMIDKNINYILLEAIDINDHGQIICLAKDMIDYDYHLVLLTPEYN